MINTLSISKLAAAVTVAALLFSTVFALPARAATAEELQAQIQSLLATIASLQSQLAAMGGGSTTGGSAGAGLCGVTFTQSHKLGDRGGQVQDIQRFLNTDPDTRVAATGPGSPGNETTYFGPATKAAVSKFQAKYASDILAPVGLTAPTGFWGPSTIAKANAINQARCAAANNNDNQQQTPSGTGVTVTPAAQPANSLAPKNAQHVPFTRFTLTAGSQSVTIEDVVVELTGLASRDSFDSVELLDENGMVVGDTDSFDSNNKANVGGTFTLRAGESKTFTVAANMNSSVQAGEVAAISVDAIQTSSTVNGTLPITGAQHTINSTLAIGSLTATYKSVSNTTNVNDEDVRIARINLDVPGSSSEDVRIKRIKLHQTGTADLTDALDNAYAKFNGQTYTVTFLNDDYLLIDFGSGVVVEDGDSEDVSVYADIDGEGGKNITLEIEETTHIVANGDRYSYGVPVTVSGTPETVTISGGDVILNDDSDFNSGEKVAAGTNGASMGAFTVEVKGEDITADVEVEFKITGASSATADDIELTGVAIYDENGNRISDREDATFSATTDNTTTTVSFKNVPFKAGDEMVYTIKANVPDSAPNGMFYEVTTVDFSNVENESGDTVTNISGDPITLNHDIEVAGTDFTVKVKEPDTTKINNKNNQVLAVFEFDATDSGDDVEVTELTVTASSSEVFSTSKRLRNCVLQDENGNQLGSDSEDSPTSGGNFSAIYDFSYTVAKGEKKEVSLVCDVDGFSNNATIKVPAATTDDKFDAEGTQTNTKYNNADVDGTQVTVTVTTGSPTFDLKGSDEENKDKLVRDNADDVILAVYEYYSKDAETTIDDVTVTFASNVSSLLDGDVSIYIAGSKVDSATPTNASPSTVTFTNLNKKVAKDAKVDVVLKADAQTGASGDVQISTIVATTTEGTTVADPSDTEPVVKISNAVPVVTQINTDITNLSTANDVPLLAYTVKAEGGDIQLGTTTFELYGITNTTLSNAQVRVFSTQPTNVGTDTATAEFAAALNGSTTANATIDMSSVTVSENDTYYVYLIADVDVTGDTRSVRVMIEDSTYSASNGMQFTADPNGTATVIDGSLVLKGDMKALLKQD